MAVNILMPALSPTMTDGTLARWVVGEGDAVRSGDVIAEIETENQEGFEKVVATIRKLSRVVSTMTLNVIDTSK